MEAEPDRRRILKAALLVLLGVSGCGSPPPAPVRHAAPEVPPLKKVGL